MKKYSVYIAVIVVLAAFGCTDNDKSETSDIQCTTGQTQCGNEGNINTLYTCENGKWDSGTPCAEDTPLCSADLSGKSSCIAKPVSGYHAVILCSDGLDNDGDTLIDCADEDCTVSGTADNPGPGAAVCSSPAFQECFDGQTRCGRNDDLNVLYKCQNGKWNEGSPCPAETPMCIFDISGHASCISKSDSGFSYLTLCTDGKDNDGDTLIDCADDDCNAMGTNDHPGPGATICIKSSNNECISGQTRCGEKDNLNTLYACNGGSWDAGTKCPENSPICMSDNTGKSSCIAKPKTGNASIILCSDGADNDGDTLIDCLDDDCLFIGTASTPGPGTTVCVNDKAPICREGETKCDHVGNAALKCSKDNHWEIADYCDSVSEICAKDENNRHACLKQQCIQGETKCGHDAFSNTLYRCADGRWDQGTDCGTETCGTAYDDDIGYPSCHPNCTEDTMICRRGTTHDKYYICRQNKYITAGVCDTPSMNACNIDDDGKAICAACRNDEISCADAHTFQACNHGIYENPTPCPDETPDCVMIQGKGQCIKKECSDINDKKCGTGDDKNILYTCNDHYQWSKEADCALNHMVCGQEFDYLRNSCHETCEEGHQICGVRIHENPSSQVPAYTHDIYTCENNTYKTTKSCRDFCNIHSDSKAYCENEKEGTSQCVDENKMKTFTDGKWVTTTCPPETPSCVHSTAGDVSTGRCIKKECETIGGRRCGTSEEEKNILYECNEQYQWEKIRDCEFTDEVCGTQFENTPVNCHRACTPGDGTCRIDENGLDSVYICDDNNNFILHERCPHTAPFCNILEGNKAKCEANPTYTTSCDRLDLKINYNDENETTATIHCKYQCIANIVDRTQYLCLGTECHAGGLGCINEDLYQCSENGKQGLLEDCIQQGKECTYLYGEGYTCFQF